MGDEAAEIQPTLTSTMGNVLLSQNNDKNDANDSTPTSSTDAASTCSNTPLNATDDPISSTSSDLSEKNKVAADVVETKKDMDVVKNQATSDCEVDLLDMNIGNVSSEPINEEMEDIVQDLQKILGEAESIDDLPPKRRSTQHDTSTDEKFLSSLDNLESKEGEIAEAVQINESQLSQEAVAKDDETDASVEKLQILVTHSENSSEDNLCLNKELKLQSSDNTKLENCEIKTKLLKDECDKEECIMQLGNKELDTSKTNTCSEEVEKENLPSQLKNCPEHAAVSTKEIEERDCIETDCQPKVEESTERNTDVDHSDIIQAEINEEHSAVEEKLPETVTSIEDTCSKLNETTTNEEKLKQSEDCKSAEFIPHEVDEKPQLEEIVEPNKSENIPETALSSENYITETTEESPNRKIQQEPEEDQHQISDEVTKSVINPEEPKINEDATECSFKNDTISPEDSTEITAVDVKNPFKDATESCDIHDANPPEESAEATSADVKNLLEDATESSGIDVAIHPEDSTEKSAADIKNPLEVATGSGADDSNSSENVTDRSVIGDANPSEDTIKSSIADNKNPLKGATETGVIDEERPSLGATETIVIDDTKSSKDAKQTSVIDDVIPSEYSAGTSPRNAARSSASDNTNPSEDAVAISVIDDRSPIEDAEETSPLETAIERIVIDVKTPKDDDDTSPENATEGSSEISTSASVITEGKADNVSTETQNVEQIDPSAITVELPQGLETTENVSEIENVEHDEKILDTSLTTAQSSEDVKPENIEKNEDLIENVKSDVEIINPNVPTEKSTRVENVENISLLEKVEEMSSKSDELLESSVDLPEERKSLEIIKSTDNMEESITPTLTTSEEIDVPSSECSSVAESVKPDTNANIQEIEQEQIVPELPHLIQDNIAEEPVEKVLSTQSPLITTDDISQPIIQELCEGTDSSQHIANSAAVPIETVSESAEVSLGEEKLKPLVAETTPIQETSEAIVEELPEVQPEERTQTLVDEPETTGSKKTADIESINNQGSLEETKQMQTENDRIGIKLSDQSLISDQVTYDKQMNCAESSKERKEDSIETVLPNISVESKSEESVTEDHIDIPCQEEITAVNEKDSEKTSLVIESDSSMNQNVELESSENPEIPNKSNVAEETSSKTSEKLIQVVEEVIVKKTIIYEHDCHHHRENVCESKLTGKDEIEESGEIDEEQIVPKDSNETDRESDKLQALSKREINQVQDSASKVSQESLDSQSLLVTDTGTVDLGQTSIKTVLPDSKAAEDIQAIEAAVVIEASEDKVTAASSSTFGHSIRSKEPIQEHAVKHSTLHDKIHDQTTAAVQSILDNMLAEEQNIVEITEKEEAPVVHSSYSSYELQKAVQQIQDISPVDNTEEISHLSPEALPFESIAEKQIEPSENLIDTIHVENAEENAMEVIKQENKESIQEVTEGSKISESQPITNLEVEDQTTHQHLITDSIHEVKQHEIQACSTVDTEKNIAETVPKQSNLPVQKEPELPIVQPSIDLSEESSSEESLEEDNTQNKISSTTRAEPISNDTQQNAQKEIHTPRIEPNENVLMKGDIKKTNLKETRQSTKTREKSKDRTSNSRGSVNEPLSINIEESEKEKSYSPRITIKPIREEEPIEEREEHKGSLKITITKQSDNTHSILKICSPDMEQRHRALEAEEQNVVPKLVIKTADVEQHSPKMSTRSSKQSISANANQRSGSPRITIKPILKPEGKEPLGSPLKITIKPMGKPEEFSKQQQQRHSPKLPRSKAEDDHYGTRSKVLKTSEISEVHSPKVTIKPVVKPPDEIETMSTPKITIKPIEKPESEAKVSPKIIIKPVLKPIEIESEPEDEGKKRIVLKINKGTIPSKESEKPSRKRDHEEDKSEKLAKIKLKFSKGGDAHIVHEAVPEKHSPSTKRGHDSDIDKCKRLKVDNPGHNSDEDVKIIEDRQSPIVISEDSRSQDSVILIEEVKEPIREPPVETRIVTAPIIPVQSPGPKKRGRPRKVPLVTRDEFVNMQQIEIQQPPQNPIVEQAIPETETSGRPKRSCRGQSVRDTLGIKPRKPKAPPKVRGGKRGAGAKGITKKSHKEQAFSEEKIELIKQSLTEEAVQNAQAGGLLKLSKKNQGLGEQVGQPFELKGLLLAAKDQNIIEVIEIDSPSNSPKSVDVAGNLPANTEESPELTRVDITPPEVEMQPPTPVTIPQLNEPTAMDISHSSDIAIFEEETRMSADVNSRAQTPAKQVVSADVVVEESQSSMQSTATTESGKINRKGRLEVHQEPDTAIVTADQLNEYYWGGNGPFMIQEQVAQFLGIKSFKRKYPGLPRRMVDMQERDYIRENGLASESMCDLGLTAVNSADILDIMYSDFQDKYEEYCKYQRDKQAKDLISKQKALSLASGQEKNKLDIMEQAIQSAASYNANFNKVRKEQRRACMDLQTMNVHYPKGKIKPINMPKIGHYPVAVVPGQYTDYYKEFTPTEINNLPLNTMLYKELHKVLPDVSDSDSDSSGSDSDDSSSSDSDSDSSCDDGCKMCNTPSEKKGVTPRKSPIHAGL